MKILVFGYQAVGHACLSALIELEPEVIGLVTHEDNPNEKIWFPSCLKLAKSKGIDVITPSETELKGEAFSNWVKQMAPELIFSFYYRYLIPVSILKLAHRGGINLHGSLLPRYRGRCPVNWVIINDEKESGVTLHTMVKKADAGDIWGQRRVPIAPRETADSLYQKLIPEATALLKEVYPLIKEDKIKPVSQDHRHATLFGGRRPDDGEINWYWPARRIDCMVRAVTHPFPGAFTFRNANRVLIWEGFSEESVRHSLPGEVVSLSNKGAGISTGSGIFWITSVQEGDTEIKSPDFWKEHKWREGQLLGRVSG